MAQQVWHIRCSVHDHYYGLPVLHLVTDQNAGIEKKASKAYEPGEPTCLLSPPHPLHLLSLTHSLFSSLNMLDAQSVLHVRDTKKDTHSLLLETNI